MLSSEERTTNHNRQQTTQQALLKDSHSNTNAPNQNQFARFHAIESQQPLQGKWTQLQSALDSKGIQPSWNTTIQAKGNGGNGNDKTIAHKFLFGKGLVIYLADSQSVKWNKSKYTGAWDYIVVKDLRDAVAWLENNLLWHKYDSMVIRQHGNTSDGIQVKNSPKNASQEKGFIYSRTIRNPKKKDKFLNEQINAYKKLSGFLNEGATVVNVACGAGRCELLHQDMFDLMNQGKGITLYMNNDPSSFTMTEEETGKTSFKIGQPITKWKNWGSYDFSDPGWTKITSGSRPTETDKNLQLNFDGTVTDVPVSIFNKIHMPKYNLPEENQQNYNYY